MNPRTWETDTIFTQQELELLVDPLPFQQDCCICLDTETEIEYLFLCCRHVFHRSCMFTWLKTSARCPICSCHVEYKMRNDTLKQLTTCLDLLYSHHDELCCICRTMDDIPWIRLVCAHMYHADCFQRWIEKRLVYPLDAHPIEYQINMKL